MHPPEMVNQLVNPKISTTSYKYVKLCKNWVSGISGMEWWNGLLEWTTGMEYWNGLGQNLFTCI